MKPATLLSAATMAAACRCSRSMASKLVPSAASVVPRSWAVSSLGRKPLGMITASQMVATSTANEAASAIRRRAITQSRVRRYQRSEAANARSVAESGAPPPCRPGLRKRLPSIGVSVSDTNPETRMATPMVTANSRNSRPTRPPMNTSGMNTATSEMVMDRMVKPISRAPSKAACRAGFPISMWRTMFSSITMASSTTNPTDSVSAISDRLSRL